jgi:alpha-tubulin suppressor-like RCC1 family protein
MDERHDPATIDAVNGQPPAPDVPQRLDGPFDVEVPHDVPAGGDDTTSDLADASTAVRDGFDGLHDILGDLPPTDAVDGLSDVLPDGPPWDTECTAPLVPCGGLCVDTRTNPLHCGRCDRMCSGTCSMGECFEANDVATGAEHTCAISREGRLRCWGANEDGQVGNGSTSNQNRPVAVGEERYVTVGLGNAHSCAVRADGAVRCWGANNVGQLGDGTRTASSAPVLVQGLGNAVQVVGGNNFTCARLMDSSVRCWGSNQRGQLGNGLSIDSLLPVMPLGLVAAVDIAAGNEHVCAALTNGRVSCWGRNDRGQLGHSDTMDVNRPREVSGLVNVRQIEAGSKFTCALTTNNEVRCWGENNHRQLGNNSTVDNSATPVTVMNLQGLSVAQLGCGGNQCCVVLSEGSVRCWGDNARGQLGDGTMTDRGAPVVVMGLTDAVQVTTRGNGHTCARSNRGTIACWGDNAKGQLGDGSLTNRLTPTPVAF